jgi:hypothetical protein
MRLFDCQCKWRFIIGETHVYGPIYATGLPGHGGCYSQGRMMTVEQFGDDYSDCFYNAAMTNPANQVDHVHPFTD